MSSSYTVEAQLKATGVSQFQQAFANAEQAMSGFEKAGKSIGDVGKKLTKGLTLPLVGIGTVAIKSGMEFEASMSKVQSVTGASAEEMQQLENSAREAGATTNKSAQEAAEALEYMGLAGWSVTDSQKALLPVLKLSSAAGMDLGATSDMVTDTMGVMGLGADDLGGYLDTLAETSRSSNTSVEQLGEAILVVGGTAKGLGVETDELSTSLGILADNGIKGSKAGTGLNAIIANMSAPVGRAKEAMDELGISVFDADGNFIGIEESMQLLEDSMVGMTDEQKNMYKSMIAGKGHGDVLNAMLNGLGEGYDNLSGNIEGAEGALDEMYDVMTDNTQGAIDNLMSSLSELGLKIFDNLQPAVEKLVEWVQKVSDKFNSFDESQQQTIVSVGLMVAAIGPVLLIISKLIAVVVAVTKVFVILKPIVLLVGAVIGGITAPVALAIAAFVALVAGGVALYKNWDTVKAKASELKAMVVNRFNELKTGATTAMNNMKTSVTNAFEGAKSAAVSRATGLKDGAMRAFNSLLGSVRSVFSNVRSAITTAFSNINLFSAGRAIIDGFVRGLKSAWEAGKKFIGGIGTWIKNNKGPISYDRKLLVDAGDAIIGGLNKGLQDSFPDVQRTVSGMAGAIENSLTASPTMDIAGNIARSNAQVQTAVSHEINNGSAKQPAVLNIQLGKRNYRAFVEDISNAQSQNIQFETSYGL